MEDDSCVQLQCTKRPCLRMHAAQAGALRTHLQQPYLGCVACSAAGWVSWPALPALPLRAAGIRSNAQGAQATQDDKPGVTGQVELSRRGSAAHSPIPQGGGLSGSAGELLLVLRPAGESRVLGFRVSVLGFRF